MPLGSPTMSVDEYNQSDKAKQRQAAADAANAARPHNLGGPLGAGPTVGLGGANSPAQPPAASLINSLFGTGGTGGALGGLIGGGGGVGLPLGTVGAGGGSGGGSTPPAMAPPFQQGASLTAQASNNPFIQQLMQMNLQNAQTPLDFAGERSALRKEQSLKLNEARQGASAGGRGGLWGAQEQQLQRGFGEDLAGQEANFGNRQAAARTAALAGATGIAGVGTQEVANMLQAQLAAQKQNQEAMQWQAEYPYQMQALQNQALNGRISAITSLLGSLV